MKEVLLTSSVLILAVIVLRLLFRNKVSRTLIYGAWLLVALRLLIPIQFGELNFSVLSQAAPVTEVITDMAQKPVSGPSREEVYHDTLQDYISQGQSVFIPEVQEKAESEIIQSGRPAEDVYDEILESNKPEAVVLPEVNQQIETVVEQTVSPTLGQIALVVWIVGMVAMTAWFLGVNLTFRRNLRSATPSPEPGCKTPVKVSAAIASPCVFGLLRPVIYLTPNCVENPQIRRHVLTHEQTHLRHGDHIWAWIRCVCLCIYWFNPLVWVAASLSKRDCELACDEAALKTLGEDERLAYGKTLVDMVSSVPAPGQLLETATAMHETKKQLKERVKCIVKQPKVFLTAAIALLLVLTIVTGCAFSGAATRSATAPSDSTQPTTEGTTPTTEITPPTTEVTPPTTEVPPITEVTPPTSEVPDPELEAFDELFKWTHPERNPYVYATGHEYSSPQELKLKAFFDGGFEGEHTLTDTEFAELKKLSKYPDTFGLVGDFNRLPKDKMDAELQAVFGISLKDLPDSAFEGLTYLKSTDCYYFSQSAPTSTPRISNFLSIEHNIDGTVTLGYDYDFGETSVKRKITLKPHCDSYLVLSNVRCWSREAFDELFGLSDGNNIYFPATSCEYASPKEIKLAAYFCNNFGRTGEISDAEWAELFPMTNPTANVQRSVFFRLTKADLDQALQNTFGISLTDLPDSAYEGLYYLESTDCYYLLQTESPATPIVLPFLSVTHNTNGTVSLTYKNIVGETYMITLENADYGYLVLSNVKVKN